MENCPYDITDAMMENLQENFNQDVESMVRLMESTDDIVFDSENKQNNSKVPEVPNEPKTTVINSEKSEAYNLLAQGKRNLFVKDYESAVETLSEACEKLRSIYGEIAVECGDAYMTYGSALLELWRTEEANKTQEENVEEQEMNENEDNENNESNNEDNENDNKDKEGDEDDNEIENSPDSENNEEINAKEDENEEEEDAEELEDDDNLSLAWQILEVAKKIYTEHSDNLNLAKVYIKLGEVSVASGNYQLAIEDFQHSLEIQRKFSTQDCRLKANCHFHLYIAYLALHSYDDAANEIYTAKSTLESQLLELGDKLKSQSKNENIEVTNKIRKEINDLEDILREVNTKINESHSKKREFVSALFDAINKRANNEESSSSGQSNMPETRVVSNTISNNVPVSNISHLIRKKPKVSTEKVDVIDHNNTKTNEKENSVTFSQSKSTSNENDATANSRSEINVNDVIKNTDTEVPDKKCKLNDENIENESKKQCSEINVNDVIKNTDTEVPDKKRKLNDEDIENESKKQCVR